MSLHCRRCGYSLKGLTGRVCPECGRGFDPSDPGTVRTSEQIVRSRRRRRYLLLSSIFLVVALIAGIYFTRDRWEVHEVWSICTYCAAKREWEEYHFCGVKLLSSTSTDSDTLISRFLAEHRTEHEHDWRVCITFHYDIFGNRRLPNTRGPESRLVSLLLTRCSDEDLARAEREVPDLKELIIRDIIDCQTKGAGNRAALLMGALENGRRSGDFDAEMLLRLWARTLRTDEARRRAERSEP
jgi:hypothetical protein